MTVIEFNELTKLNVGVDEYSRIEKAYMLFPNLSKVAFCTMWMTLTDAERKDMILAQETHEAEVKALKEQIAKKDREISRLKDDVVVKCAKRLAHEYAENGSEETREVGMEAVGTREFYALLLEGGYDLNEEDREDIAYILRK